jgi:hypothetical protein
MSRFIIIYLNIDIKLRDKTNTNLEQREWYFLFSPYCPASLPRTQTPYGTHKGMYNSHKGLFSLMLIHVDWMRFSRFKSIASQNPPLSISIPSDPHGMRITEQGLNDSYHKRYLRE